MYIWGFCFYIEKNMVCDNGFLVLFIYGEGYYNFYYIFVSDYCNGIKWYYYDFMKWMICLLVVLGLVLKLKCIFVECIEKVKVEILMNKI